jgi:cytoskeletal protein RodZ
MIRIGQKLREERQKRGLSLDEVAEATKIKSSFLSAIERGDYQKLPSSAYAQGFVSNYASFLGLPKRETLAIFRREFESDKEIKVLPEGFSGKNSAFRSVRVHQTLLLVLAVFLVLIGYIIFQYRYTFINPPLSVSSPEENAVITGGEVTVAGRTDPNVTVMINDDGVVVNQKGEFMKKITAFSGKTIILIKAKNRAGRETTVERAIEVK